PPSATFQDAREYVSQHVAYRFQSVQSPRPDGQPSANMLRCCTPSVPGLLRRWEVPLRLSVQSLLVTGCYWLLVTGYWLLVTGCWSPGAGYLALTPSNLNPATWARHPLIRGSSS